MNLFRYLAARLRHRGPLFAQYMHAGLGLEQRARLLSPFWSDHLSRSRSAQARWALDCRGVLLTVLGAGPLFDFNAAAFAPCFQRFRLVDANPLAQSLWAGLNKPVEPVITDITNIIGEWSGTVRRYKGSWDETLRLLRELAKNPKPAYGPKTDAVLSLNILSQLDVGWQESLEPVLQKRFGRDFVHRHQQDWLTAIRPTSQVLAEQHLAALEASNAENILIISDVEYLDYTGRQYSRETRQPPPVSWTGHDWQAEPGIEYELTAALEGLELNADSLSRWLPSYQTEWHDTWLWHIAPQGTEKVKHGTIHRVMALSLRRNALHT